MNPVCEILRGTREQRGITLENLAAATRIQKKFLEALEEGDFSILPQTYVRAFLKSYAKEVGLDPTAIMKTYESGGGRAQMESGTPLVKDIKTEAGQARELRESAGRSSQRTVLFVASTVVISGLILSLYAFREPEPTSIVSEIPFQEVLLEREKTNDSAVVASSDSITPIGISSVPIMGPFLRSRDTSADAQAAMIGMATPIPVDSLTLRIMTFDSVAIRVVIDGKKRRDYRVPGRWSGKWKAADHFLLSIDNPAFAAITLDNMAIRPFIDPGRPLKNVKISSASSPRRNQPRR